MSSACFSEQSAPIVATTFGSPFCMSHQTPVNPSTTIRSSTGALMRKPL